MGTSRKKSTLGPAVLCHTVDRIAYPERTAGSLGINDAGDPNRLSLLGDTPGPTGVNDCGAPRQYMLPGLNTFHDWALEAKFHLPVEQQVAALYPAGSKEEVLVQATNFLTESERVEEHPYVPVNKDGSVIGVSGVTIGLGYDLGQHSEVKIRQDWAELDTRSQPPSISAKGRSLGIPELKVDESLLAGMPPPKPQPLKLSLDPMWTDPSPLDLLAQAAGLQKDRALKYLPKVKGLTIFKDLALTVFRKTMLPEYYDLTAKFFPGLAELPTGVQVALLSLVFNTGTVHRKEGKVMIETKQEAPATSSSPSASFGLELHLAGIASAPSPRRASKLSFGLEPLHLGTAASAKKAEPEPEPKMETKEEEDFFGNDWEKKELRTAVYIKDLVWIYWYFESSRRIWAKEPGLVKRRNDEASLILRYVYGDLQREAMMRRYQRL